VSLDSCSGRLDLEARPRNLEGQMTDLSFEDRGQYWLMHSNTDAGAEWIKRYVPANAPKLGEAIVINHRIALSVVKLTFGDGLKIDVNGQAIERKVEHRYLQ
jgi:hypothetical protein